MSGYCMCSCGCERLDPELDYETSSDMTCMPCCLGKHRRPRRANRYVTVPLPALERMYEGRANENDRAVIRRAMEAA